MRSDTPAGRRKKTSVTITDVQEKMPAEKAGLKEGDKILALDGKPVPALGAMVESLRNHEGQADHAYRAAERPGEDIYDSARAG